MRNSSLVIALLLLAQFSLLFGQVSNVTRLEGIGAGNNFLEITDQTRTNILSTSFDGSIEYKVGKAPIQIEIRDSATFTKGTFLLELADSEPSDNQLTSPIFWTITHEESGTSVTSIISIEDEPTQYVPEFGLSVTVNQTLDVGEIEDTNGAIGIHYSYEDPTGPEWFSGVPDEGPNSHFDYIRTEAGQIDHGRDPMQKLSTMGEGIFVPYTLCNWRSEPRAAHKYPYISPIWFNDASNITTALSRIQELNNVDLVFTSDTNLWSRCIVVETASPEYYDSDNGGLGLATQEDEVRRCEVKNMDLRGGYSVGKKDQDADGIPDPDREIINGKPRTGMAWFPGYAVDVETGERLNIFFGENSAYSLDQDSTLLARYDIDADDFELPPAGRDMMWNPSSQIDDLDAGDGDGFPYPLYAGGQHFIYITNQKYDSCQALSEEMVCGRRSIMSARLLSAITWTALPVLAEGAELLSYAEGLIPNDLKIELRVDNPFQLYTGTGQFNQHPAYEFTVKELTSVEDKTRNSLESITVHPNPISKNQSNTQIELRNVPLNSHISVHTAAGDILSTFPVGGTSRNERSKVKISEMIGYPLTTGTYFIRILNNSKTHVLKLVVI